MLVSERNRNFSVELCVKKNSEPTFYALKELQEIGYAHEDSTIVFNGIRVPAGYCADFQQFIVTYSAIVSGDHALVYDQIPLEFSELDAAKFLAVCSKSMESQGREPFSQSEVSDFFEYRRSQKSFRQK